MTQHWTVEVGLGYATPLLVGDRIYMYARQDDDEVMVAIDARDGSIIWRTSYPAPFDMFPATARHRAGPKSTPAFADGRLFTLGISGIVSAFSVETGPAALAEARAVRPAALPHRDVSGGRRQPGDVSRRWA